MKALRSVKEVVTAFGGQTAAAARFGIKAQSVQGWLDRDRLPPERYLEHSAVLAEMGFTAPVVLWGLREPARKRRVAA